MWVVGLNGAQQDVGVDEDRHLQAALTIDRVPTYRLVGQERGGCRVAVCPATELAHPFVGAHGGRRGVKPVA